MDSALSPGASKHDADQLPDPQGERINRPPDKPTIFDRLHPEDFPPWRGPLGQPVQSVSLAPGVEIGPVEDPEKVDQDMSDALSSSSEEEPEPYIEKGLPLLFASDADTLVYLDPIRKYPSAEMECPVTTVPHRVHSQNLLSTGSPYFQKLFQPECQSHTIKRRGLAGRFPEHVKYVIDLTPPTEEDEAVIFIMKLSCPPGVRSWAFQKNRWSLPVACVGGRDELEPKAPRKDAKEKKHKGKTTEDGDGEKHGQNRSDFKSFTKELEKSCHGREKGKSTKKPRLPLEYSATHHRAALERVLHALEGHEVTLDTPAKVWTFFAIADIFQVASTPLICDRIMAWLYESTNTRFIEIHPEVTYRVACGIKCSPLCRVAFSILVGEEAMLLLGKPGKPADLSMPSKTFHGRIRDTLEDSELQRVEYASKNFMEYVVDRFLHLAGADMTWVGGLPEFQKISEYRAEAESQTLLSTVKELVRGYIYSDYYKAPYTWTPEPYIPPIADDEYPSKDFKYYYGRMRCIERMMSRTFWGLLETEQFYGNWFVHCPQSLRLSSVADISNMPIFKNHTEAKIVFIHHGTLEEKVNAVNDRIRSSESTDEDVVSTDRLFWQVRAYVSEYARQMTQPPHANDMLLHLTDTLTCLSDNEYKYLPLWAGGNDDGSGGVFTDQGIPDVEAGGFTAPGPGIKTGTPAPTDEESTTMATDYETTVQGASHYATESHRSDVLSLASAVSSLAIDDDAEEIEANNDTTLGVWRMEDDAPSPVSSDSEQQSDAESDGSGSSDTVGKRQSISDFLVDEDDVLELDLEDDVGAEADSEDGF